MRNAPDSCLHAFHGYHLPHRQAMSYLEVGSPERRNSREYLDAIVVTDRTNELCVEINNGKFDELETTS